MPKPKPQPTAPSSQTPAPQRKPAIKVITVNRKAYHDYHILETYEAGIALKGTEIKSIREGRIQIRDAYARPEGGEIWLYNCHIAPYSKGGPHNHPPTRPRKLLLRRAQIDDIIGSLARRGMTLVPLKVYIKGRLAKVELGLAKGKRQYEKREAIQEREAREEMARFLKRSG
ncbi:MAG: SsrA-binding protein SmpB [Dehalococcoidia bacterium]|nr:SsrA-binding protein SmpB [Dehalococcoidia bacterium]MDW8119274.1 SsrA-binding protein SmpB [Chloroflexota bacterium]